MQVWSYNLLSISVYCIKMWVNGSEVNQPGGYKLFVISPIKVTLVKIIADFHGNKSKDNKFLILIIEICKSHCTCRILHVSICLSSESYEVAFPILSFHLDVPILGQGFFFWKGREENGRASKSYPKYLEMEGDKVCLVDKKSGL